MFIHNNNETLYEHFTKQLFAAKFQFFVKYFFVC